MESKDFVIKNGELKKYLGENEVVIIPDGVKSIGGEFLNDYVDDKKNLFHFAKFSNIVTKVVLPDSVETIKPGAFRDCVKLNSVNIPVGLEEIGDFTFSGCISLTSIRLPFSVKSIGVAFRGCRKLERLNIPDSVRVISARAFEDCGKLKEFVLSGEVTEFKDSVIEKLWNSIYDGDIDRKESESVRTALLFSILKYANKSLLKEKQIQAELKQNKWNLVKHAINNDDAEIIQKILEIYKITNPEEIEDYLQYAKNTVEVKVSIMNYKNEVFQKKKGNKNDILEKEYKL
ncbi:MAG: leucine-rich repeat domain-containing protein [Clostridia bacterium]|nr:leucine-rich repeat domain-containing protein [Clostridia bacterium]